MARADVAAAAVPPATFDAAGAVPLAHALVHHLGAGSGVRMFSIKGPTLTVLGLRGERLVADADVWVEPDGVDALSAALGPLGWRPRFERDDRQARFLPAHSRSFTHSGWPCDIDLHWWFPGLGVGRADAFEALWARSVAGELANRQVRMLDRPAAGLIAVLHGLRHPRSPLHRDELDDLIGRLAACPASEREALADLAERLGAVEVMTPVLTALGVPRAAQPLTARARRDWFEYTQTHDAGSAAAWMAQLRDAGWRDKPTVLGRALWLSGADLRAASPDAAPGWGQRMARRMSRWGRGLRETPQALRVLFGRAGRTDS